MKIRTFIDIVNRVYQVEIHVTDVSEYEKELIANFGEPEVNVGGSFVGSITAPGGEIPTEVEFAIPDRYLRVINDFPYKQVFDLRDDENASLQAKIYADEIVARLASAKVQLLENASPYEGEYVINL